MSIGTVCCVGAGLIGAGWVAHFLRAGLTVCAYDPRPEAEAFLKHVLNDAWPICEQLGLAPGAARDRVSFTTDLGEALRDADFVQESAVEDEALKIELLADLDRRLEPKVIVASSSSGFLAESLRSRCRHGGRVLVGHPFNPPYLIPLVEVVGGKGADPAKVEEAMAFYRSTGSRPILLRAEALGYIANRIQTAVFKEIAWLLQEGVASVAEIDDAITHGPALRWAIGGPSRIYYLGATDPARYKTFLDWCFDSLNEGYCAPDGFVPSAELRDAYVKGVDEMIAGRERPDLLRLRDRSVVQVRKAVAKAAAEHGEL
jgi:carnitine 3-dehydrogenase